MKSDRFFSWGWFVERLSFGARRARGNGPAQVEQNAQRVQQYLDFLRENGPVPGPAPQVEAPLEYSKAA